MPADNVVNHAACERSISLHPPDAAPVTAEVCLVASYAFSPTRVQPGIFFRAAAPWPEHSEHALLVDTA